LSKILHIIVNYKSDEQSTELINQLRQLEGNSQVSWVLVNNSAIDSKDDSLKQKLTHVQNLTVVNCPDNPGYFGAAARACQELDPREYTYTILSNSDLQIMNSDFYQVLLNYGIESETAAIAPSIKSNLTKKESNPLYLQRPSSSKLQRLEWVYSNIFTAWIYHLLSWMKNRFAGSQSLLEHSESMYALNGSFIILHKNFFLKGGNFSYPVKLYGEEIFLAEQLRRLNLKTVFMPDLKVVHDEKGTEKSWISRYTISYRTFLYKKEAAKFLSALFKSN